MKMGVIHDWDGVLSNSRRVICNVYSHLIGKPYAYVDSHLGHDWKKFVREEGILEIHPDEWQRLLKQFGGTNLLPGAKNYLSAIKRDGYRMGLATSTYQTTVDTVLTNNGINGIFDVMVTAENVARLKPHPECLNVAVHKLGLPANHCVYIGDADVDAEASKAAGIKFIGVGWGFDSIEKIKSVNNDKIAFSFEELYDIIKSL